MPYNPAHDEVTDVAVLDEFITRHPLAALVTYDGAAPDLDLVPLLLISNDAATAGRSLVGHIARANPLWRPGRHEGTTLATFGPIEHYVSPNWYPSKAEHHRTVPTWNYLVVHAWGRLVVHDDTKWVRGVVARLTAAMEADQPRPWRMAEAPRDYLEEQLAEIVGVELVIDRLVGRFKTSAHRSEADRLGARDGIRAHAEQHGTGRGVDELTAAMTDPPTLHDRQQP